jgi:hypothetical protein
MCLTCHGISTPPPPTHAPVATLPLSGSGSADEAMATMAIAVNDNGASRVGMAVRWPASVGGGSEGGDGTVVGGS